MPRPAIDPNLLQAPDFASNAYAVPRNAIVQVLQVTDEAAAGQLLASWTEDNDRQKEGWARQLEAVRMAEEQAIRPREEEEDKIRIEKAHEEEAECKDKKKSRLNPLTPNKAVGAVVVRRPSHYAIQRLQQLDYVELSYFTEEGCEDKASHKVLSDNELTWRQMTMAKHSLLHYMSEADWPREYIVALAEFFRA